IPGSLTSSTNSPLAKRSSCTLPVKRRYAPSNRASLARRYLNPLTLVMSSSFDNRFRAAVAHPIPVRPILILVDNDVRDRFAAFRIHMLVFKVEPDLAAIIGNNLAALGQHDDWQLRTVVCLLGDSDAGYEGA